MERINPIGLSGTDLELLLIKKLFRTALRSRYVELSYDISGNLSSVDVWTDDTKTTKLFTRVLVYVGDDLSGVVTVDEVSGTQLTQVLSYDGNGTLLSLNEELT